MKILNEKILNEESLREASDQLHDAVFEAESIVFDEEKSLFQMELWRECRNETRTENIFWFFRRTKTLRRRCSLEFFDIRDATISRTGNLDFHSLFRIYVNSGAGHLVFETEGAVEIELSSCSSINGELIDSDETTWNQFGYETLGSR
jgi:hypothetical protein